MSIYQPAEDSYLLQEVLKKELPILLKKNPHLKVLEIGAGSGIHLKTINELGLNKKYIWACDKNIDAVKHCKLKLGFNCIKSDLFEKYTAITFDVIIFNPPYLPEEDKEPQDSRLATTGGKKGSEIINKFLKQAKKHLTKDGEIFLLTSSLTKGINWNGWKKKNLAEKKLFMEKLFIYSLE